MRVTFLGTGTSQGVPIINCDCKVCTSSDPRNKRLRTSVSVTSKLTSVLIDTTPDLRQQLLRNPLDHLDAILYTHAHADHIYGIDDIRRFNQLQEQRIPAYADTGTLNRLRKVFDYAFGEGPLQPGLPNLEARPVRERFKIKNLEIIPIHLFHGQQEILGYRIDNLAYCTDVSHIPETSYKYLQNLDILILDALRDRSHPTHFTVEQAIEEAHKIKARNTYFIHMSHKIDHVTRAPLLPEGMYFAYDGLTLILDGGG